MRDLKIAFGGSRLAKMWSNKTISYEELCSRLASTIRTPETAEEYSMFDFHSLRHTHATELSEAGVNIKEIQRRLGHKTLDVTNKRYIHATDIMEAQSLGIMNKMYGISDAPDTP